MQIERPRSLLVLKPSSFGDIIHTLPAVSRLRAAWPDCRISWLANTEWMPLLVGNPAVDEVVEYPRREFRGPGGGWRMWRWLRTAMAARRPDLALDFQGLLRSAFAGRASGARTLAGLSDAREGARWFYHRTVASPSQPIHAVARYLALADAVLDDTLSTVGFPLPGGEKPAVADVLTADYVLVHPYSRGQGKSLSKSEVGAFLRKMHGCQTVLVGRGESDVAYGNTRCLNLLNETTLGQLIWLTRHAAFVVSVDSGPAHLAAALARPMVAIHSWSDPRRVGPYHADAWVWKNGRLVQVRNLSRMEAGFFAPHPLRLRTTDLEALAGLACRAVRL